MSLTLVAGSFGKSTLCPDRSGRRRENRRRANRLREVVDYVRWQARRFAPGRVLVVTYKDCEAAFGGHPGRRGRALQRHRRARRLPRRAPARRRRPAAAARRRAGPARRRRSSATCPRAATSRELAACACATAAVRTVRVDRACRRQGRAAAGGDLRRRGDPGDRPRPRASTAPPTNPLEVHVLADVALPLVHDRSSPGRRCSPTCSSACCSRASRSTARRRRAAASGAVRQCRAGQEGAPAADLGDKTL